MKLLIAFILVISPMNDLDKIAKANEHKKAAKEAYQNGDYQSAVSHYRYLTDSLGIQEEGVLLNLANALYKVADTTAARSIYSSLLEEKSPETMSKAHQQLGLMDFKSKEYQQALSHFKESLRSDPSNEDVRYNYELLKKLLKEQEEQQQDQQNQDQNQEEQNQDQQQQQENEQNQDQQNQDQQNQEQEQQDSEQQKENQENQEQNKEGEEQEQQDQQDENSEENQEQQQQQEGEENEEDPEQMEPSTADKLKEMNISEEKAQMILEAMKNNEIQYLQQNRRKPTKRKKSGKPDW